MFAVLKKRWKPKRAGGVNNLQHNINNNNNNTEQQQGRRAVKSVVIESSLDLDKIPPSRIATSPRQVHPMGEKVVTPPPNICVQAGRIEFIKPQDNQAGHIKEKLESRIAELEAQLEEEKKSTLKERRNTARFQALLQDRECLSRDVEMERESREEAEARLQDCEKEAASSRLRIHTLQTSLNRLEDSLRTMSLYKQKYAQLKLENSSLRNTIDRRMHSFEASLRRLTQENSNLKAQLADLEQSGEAEAESGRLRELEVENQRLVQERYQCEKCLDQVANHIVKALLSQKSLREEVVNLRERVKELETQNRALSSMLLHQHPIKQPDKSSHVGRPLSCDENKLRWSESFLWLPVDRPRSLNLESLQPNTSKSGGDAHKDEGYSTMSSEAQVETAPGLPQGGLEKLQEEAELRTISSQTEVEERVGWCGLVRSASDSQLAPHRVPSPVEFPQVEWWDMDCVQAHWLRLEETRSLLQHHIDFCPIDLEEWTMDDITPGLSSLGESGGDLDELWVGVVSPGGDSLSSRGGCSEPGSSKRSSTASECDPPATDFTSDFYRLVKFESTRSLASSSGDDPLQSVLHFIAEQDLCGRVRDSVEDTDYLDSGLVIKASDAADEAEKPSSIRSLLTVPEEEEEIMAAASLTSSISTPDTVIPPILHHQSVNTDPLEESGEVCDDAVVPSDALASQDKPSLNGEEPELPWGTTSRQLIEELNRLNEADEELASEDPHSPHEETACCPTSWVRLHNNIDLNDPKARATLLDVILSNRSSSSCSGSSDSSEDHPDYQHLHRIHRSRRHKKASANRDGMGALRRQGHQRISIVGRDDLFLRFGAKEEEAIASFDFLEEFSSSNESTACRP